MSRALNNISPPILEPLDRGQTQSKADCDLQRADARGDWEASAVARMVAHAHGVTPEELFHNSRSRAPIALTRQIAMYLTHVLLGRSLTEVGTFYGRDRTTVSYGCARVEDLRDDAAFDAELIAIEESIETFFEKSQHSLLSGPQAVSEAGAANDS